MNVLDTIVYSIWFDESNKYEHIQTSTRNRICGLVYVLMILGGFVALMLTCMLGSGSLELWNIAICFGIMILAMIPRAMITEPPEIAIREDYIRRKSQVPILMKDLQSGETTDMLYNSVYNQGVVYTEDGMKIVDLPLHKYNKTWVAFDSAREY